MNFLYVDTLYFVAIINQRDQWHEKAASLRPLLEGMRLITTEAVLMETLNFFSEYGANMRRVVALFVRDVLTDFNFEVVPNTTENFLFGLELYETRLDKGYSLTDCISMNVCRERKITDVLTHDHHFEQEGFQILL